MRQHSFAISHITRCPPPLPPLIKNRDQTRTSGFRFRPTARTAIKPPLVSPTPLNIRDNAPRGAATAEFPGSRQKKKTTRPYEKTQHPSGQNNRLVPGLLFFLPFFDLDFFLGGGTGAADSLELEDELESFAIFLSKGFLLWGKLGRFREIAFYAFFFPFFFI